MPRLIDADALLETIEDHCTALSCCLTVEQWRGKTDMKRQVIEDIHNAPTIRFAENINVPNNGWISVKDQSPKPPEDKPSILQRWYLVALENGNVTLSAYDFTSKQWRGFTGVAVTHWMPLPERPKE